MKKVILELIMMLLAAVLSTICFIRGETLLGVLWALIAVLDGVNALITARRER